jgi:2-methylcitrate dehydratase PrpD
MGQPIEALASLVAATHWDHLPEAVQQHAKLVFLDTLGVILAGSDRPEVRALRTGMAATAGTGATLLAFGWASSDPRTAALLNGIACRSIELCEGHRLVSGQAAAQVLPAVLAVSEIMGSTGPDILTALVLGYDVASRMSAAFTPRPLAHQNGQASMLGSAAACAKLRGLDAAGISLAMRIASTLVLTPSYTNVVAGATTLNVAGGMSGFAGVLAADLAIAGFGAQADAIEEALGQLVGGGFDSSGLLDELGTRWEITRNYFRLYACCNPIHPSLDALKAALAELKPAAGEIDRIDISTYRFASVMRNPDPPNYFASKYSLPHAAAVMVVRGGAGFAELDDSALTGPVIAALRHRVHIAEDPAMSAVAPKLRPARVVVTLTDGRTAKRAVESHRGDFQQPFETAEILAKFRQLAGIVLTGAGAAAVEAAVQGGAGIADLLDMLRRHAHPPHDSSADTI